MFQLAAAADHGPLAITFDRGSITAKRIDKFARHLQPERLQVLHERLDILDIAAGIRIGDDGENNTALDRIAAHRPALVKNLLDLHDHFPDDHVWHRLSRSPAETC